MNAIFTSKLMNMKVRYLEEEKSYLIQRENYLKSFPVAHNLGFGVLDFCVLQDKSKNKLNAQMCGSCFHSHL